MRIENTAGIEESLSEIGSRIKDLRIAACYTQKDLAKKSGISLSSIQRIEQGQSVQLDNMLRVMKALGLLSKLETAFHVQSITPMQLAHSETKKKTYRKPKTDKVWEWGE